MTSLLQSSFEAPRPQTHQGVHSSPTVSPQINRPASQASLHVAPVLSQFSPPLAPDASPHPFSAYPSAHPQPFKPYQPGNISLPLPRTSMSVNFPSTAPPLSYYPGPAPLYDTRVSQPMIRSTSQSYPIHSATDQTASSRYSSSPHSITHEPPPTAGGGYPTFSLSNMDDRHINPSVFNSYSMSRSTSGASDVHDYNSRLLTPHFDYHPNNEAPLKTNEADLRKVSDSLGRLPLNRYYSISPHTDFQNQHFNSISPHPQPDMGVYINTSTTRGWGNEFALSAERGGKNDIGLNAETDYERERAQQIMHNKKLLEDVGLGADTPYMRSRNASGGGGGGSHDRPRKASTPVKKRVTSEGPVRASPRIASLHRNVSYADLDGGPYDQASDDEDEYDEDGDMDEEEDFRPTKKMRQFGKPQGRKASYGGGRSARRPDLSLWGLLQVYAEIPHLFPLFYYTLNNDLTINCDSVPLIGSIPSTVTPLEKADSLRNFFHRGRRVLAQLDAFTTRCDRKYEGPEERWPELDYHTRIAIRDVRRKVVERCENYKYTRRDLLDKCVGKNKWQPIDQGMIDWRPGMTQNDPAGDLANVTLTLPTPPPTMMTQQPRQYPSRQIRPFPSRARLASDIPQSARITSVTMGEPSQYAPATAPMLGYGYPSHEAPPPMYGEDEVPMTVQMPLQTQTGLSTHTSPMAMGQAATPQMAGPGPSTGTPATFSWNDPSRGLKRSRSEDDGDKAEELDFGADRETPTLWQE